MIHHMKGMRDIPNSSTGKERTAWGIIPERKFCRWLRRKTWSLSAFQFTDMFGTLKNIAITARELPRALKHGCIVNGRFIAGVTGSKETDLYLRPDLDTFTILPWRPQEGKVARMLCDLYNPDGTPYESSSRYILKKVADEAEAEGYRCCVDPECEFFLFHTDDNGMPTTVTHERAGYLDISPLDLGENARRDIVLTLEELGIEVESSSS